MISFLKTVKVIKNKEYEEVTVQRRPKRLNLRCFPA